MTNIIQFPSKPLPTRSPYETYDYRGHYASLSASEQETLLKQRVPYTALAYGAAIALWWKKDRETFEWLISAFQRYIVQDRHWVELRDLPKSFIGYVVDIKPTPECSWTQIRIQHPWLEDD